MTDECYPYAVAQAMGEGRRLYTDIELYSYVPGPFLIHRAAFALCGEEVASGRLVGAILGALAIGTWVLAAGQVLPRWLTLLMAAVLLIAPGPWHKAYVQMTHAAWLASALMAARSQHLVPLAGCAGVTVLAAVIRIDAAVVGSVGVIWLVIARSWEASDAQAWPRRLVPSVVAAVAGSCVAAIIVALVLGTADCLSGFLAQLRAMPIRLWSRSLVVGRLLPPAPSRLLEGGQAGLEAWAWYLSLAVTIAFVGATACTVFRRMHTPRPCREELAVSGVLLVWVAGNAPQFLWERPDAAHTLQQSFSTLIAGALLAVPLASRRLRNRRRVLAALMLAATITALVGVDMVRGNGSPVRWIWKETAVRELSNGVHYPALPGGRDHEILEAVLDQSSAGDAVLAAPYLPGVNFLCQRPVPTEHYFLLPFSLPTAVQRRAFIARLEARPPTVVVLDRRFSLDGRRQGELAGWAPEISDWIDSRYRELARVGRQEILVLREVRPTRQSPAKE
jgi:hypothetical protein